MFIVQVFQQSEDQASMIVLLKKMVFEGHYSVTLGMTALHIHCSGLLGDTALEL